MKVQTRESPNKTRKARYATMGAEGADKTARNNAIVNGIGAVAAAKLGEEVETINDRGETVKTRIPPRNTLHEYKTAEKSYKKAQEVYAADCLRPNIRPETLRKVHATLLETQATYLRAKRLHEVALAAQQIQVAGLAQDTSRSAKRARAKAKSRKLVKDHKHVSRCFNVGCQRCNPRYTVH